MARTSSNGTAASLPHVMTMVDTWIGGAESFAWLVTANLDGERYRRTFCVTRACDTPVDQAEITEMLERRGVRVISLERQGKRDVAPWAKLVRYMREEHVDVLHAHKFGSNVWAALLRGRARVPIALAHEHTWSYEGQPVRRFLDRHLISRRCDRMIAVSQLDRRRMIEVEKIDPAKIVVVPVGIPPRQPTGHDVRAELGISPEDPVIATIAHLRPQKAFEVLIEATAELVTWQPNVRVLIAGNGPEKERLEDLIASLGLGENVLMLGRRRDAMDVIAAAQITVCCSDFEGSPQAVMEYMTAAKPIVATRVGGVPDLITHEESALLIEPRQPGALAQAIRELLEQPERAQAMGLRARERQRAELTMDVTMRRLDDLYSELLEPVRNGRR